MTVYAGEPQPQGTLQISRPRLLWRIWPNVTRVEMYVDGEQIDARYDAEHRAAVGTPPRPLTSGIHQVRCVVAFRGGGTTQQQWQFTIAPSKVSLLTSRAPSSGAGAYGAVNQIRRRLGLKELQLDSTLQDGARAHASYLRLNRVGGHIEQVGKPGFVGVNPAARARAFGFLEDTLVEDVAVQTVSDKGAAPQLSSAVRGLFDAPYHRLPFLNPFLSVLGAAFDTTHERGTIASYAVLLFGGTDDPARKAQTVVSPFDGEQGIATSWSGHETPDPLRLHEKVTGPVGYPIVFAHFPVRLPGRTLPPLRLDGAVLLGPDNRPVSLLVNDPRTDPELGGQAAVFLPTRPLQRNQTYTMRVSARDAQGKSIGKTWRFTTKA
ncbi:MAG: CAP domain-containing protein [Armatimonas sp.]